MRHYLFGFFVATISLFFATPHSANAANISACGTLSSADTYTMTTDFGSGGACIVITANGVIIDGAGHTITGNVTGNGVSTGNPGFNFTIQNVTVTGTTSANGANFGSGGFTPGSAGAGGTITVATSTLGVIQANGGTNSNFPLSAYNGAGGTLLITNSTFTSAQAVGQGGYGVSGVGGSITITKTALDISGTSILANGGSGSTLAAHGTTTLNYSTLTHTGTFFSDLASVNLNGTDLGSFGAGIFAAIPGDTITSAAQCNIGFTGTYTIGSDFTGNCKITNDSVILDGSGHTITGNVNGDGNGYAGASMFRSAYDFTLENLTVTGTTSAISYVNSSNYVSNGGSITLDNATSTHVAVGGGGSDGGTITITRPTMSLSGTDLFLDDGTHGIGNATLGSLVLNYTTFNHAGVSLPAVSHLILNGPGNVPGDLGAYAGGLLPAVLPGDIISDISDCNLVFAGTYTFGSNLSGNCTVSGSGVVLDGAGYTLTGNINGNGQNDGDGGFSFAVRNITVTGTTTADGSLAGGGGGTITASTSTLASVTSHGYNGENGGSITLNNTTASYVDVGSDGGNGGSITISKDALTLTDTTLTSLSTNDEGTLTLNYSTVTYSNLTTSAFSNITVNGSSLGAFGAAVFGNQGRTLANIGECNLFLPGTYTFSDSFTGNCTLKISGIILDGDDHTLTGNIIGDGVNLGETGLSFELRNITVTGTTSANGRLASGSATSTRGGSITITDSTVATTTADGAYGGNYFGNVAGPGGTIRITNSTASLLQANGGQDDPITGAALSGHGAVGGSIYATSSTITAAYANGGYSAGASSGEGGLIVLYESPTTDIQVNGGGGQYTADGGSVVITQSALSLNDVTISASIGDAPLPNDPVNIFGTLTLNYVTFDRTGTILPELSALIMNGPGNLPGNTGAFLGGALSVLPGDTINSISQCSISIGGSYTIGADMVGDCTITASGVTLIGGGHTITGNIIANGVATGASGHDITIQNLDVTGTISSNGAAGNVILDGGNGGAIIISQNSTVATTTSNGGITTGDSIYEVHAGSGGSITILNSVAGYVEASGASGVHANGWAGKTGGNGGTITVATSTTKALVANGGSSSEKNAGNGGVINVTNSIGDPSNSPISANGGDATVCGLGGNGGTVTLIDSTYGEVSTNAGLNQQSELADYCNNRYPGSSHSSSRSSSGLATILGSYRSSSGGSETQTLSSAPDITSIANIESRPVSSRTRIVVVATSTDVPVPAIVQQVANQVRTVQKSIITRTAEVVEQVREATVAVANSPAAKTVQVVGFFGGMLASVGAFASSATVPLAASEILLTPLRLWGMMLAGLGIRKRVRPWGTVYDSVTKQPIDPAYVTVADASGKVVAESITDSDGRYGFLLPDGTYYVSVKKTNYEFPSKKLVGKTVDEIYGNLYFGEPVTIIGGQVLDKNIPMDQLNFDWNEHAKKERGAFSFHSAGTHKWLVLSNYIYAIGLIISVVVVAFHQSVYNVLMLFAYVVIIVLMNVFGARTRKLGQVVDARTGEPLSYAIVRVTAYDHEVILRTAVCDARGRYYGIIPKGQYYVDIDKKNPDGSYTRVYSSDLISSDTGFLNTHFSV
jgi:hypothetical protein